MSRRYIYPLESLRQQAVWRLEKAQSALSEGLRRLRDLHDRHNTHRHEVHALQQWMARPSPYTLDPVMASNRQAYLSRAMQQSEAYAREIERTTQLINSLQETYRLEQMKSDAIEQHRTQGKRDHERELMRQAALHADDEWLTRQRWAELNCARSRATGNLAP